MIKAIPFAAMPGICAGSIAVAQGQPGRGNRQGRGWGRAINPEAQERRAARFAATDADSDGKLRMAKFLAAEKAQYEAADSDGDTKVTPWEMRAAMWQQ